MTGQFRRLQIQMPLASEMPELLATCFGELQPVTCIELLALSLQAEASDLELITAYNLLKRRIDISEVQEERFFQELIPNETDRREVRSLARDVLNRTLNDPS